MDPIEAIAPPQGLLVVEDGAESRGATAPFAQPASAPRAEHVEVGYNDRLDGLHAAL